MVPREETFEKLEQLVLDENKIVTSKMLSHELKISASESKLYMTDFYNQQKSKSSSPLHALFFVAGTIEKDGKKAIKILISTENKLEETKKNFLNISSCHIYSISKRKQVDECSLYNAENAYFKNDEDSCKLHTIKHPNVEKRLPVVTKITALQKVPDASTSKKNDTSSKVKNGISSNFAKPAPKEPTLTTNKVEGEEKSSKNTNQENCEQDRKNKEKPPKQNTLATLWQKSEEKAKDTKTDGKTKNKSPPGSAKPTSKNNIMSMFSKQAEKNSANPNKKPPVEVSKKEKESIEEDIVENVSDAEELPIKESPKKIQKATTSKNQKISTKTTKNATKKRKGSDSDDFKSQKRKHRRICVFDDSSSESESEEAQDRAQRSILDSENVEPEVSPFSKSVTMDFQEDEDEEPIPPTPPVTNHKGKKRIWKTVSKTYQDEDGYMITKQEKELVSVSDEEDPLPPVKIPPKNNFKQASVTNKKQASLTSFFSRK